MIPSWARVAKFVAYLGCSVCLESGNAARLQCPFLTKWHIYRHCSAKFMHKSKLGTIFKIFSLTFAFSKPLIKLIWYTSRRIPVHPCRVHSKVAKRQFEIGINLMTLATSYNFFNDPQRHFLCVLFTSKCIYLILPIF